MVQKTHFARHSPRKLLSYCVTLSYNVIQHFAKTWKDKKKRRSSSCARNSEVASERKAVESRGKKGLQMPDTSTAIKKELRSTSRDCRRQNRGRITAVALLFTDDALFFFLFFTSQPHRHLSFSFAATVCGRLWWMRGTEKLARMCAEALSL